MLRLLLDEHIAPAVVRAALALDSGVQMIPFKEWRHGRFMGSRDEIFLPEVFRDGLTFVTYDQKTIRPMLKGWAEQGVHHSGFIFVDTKTIAPQDIGQLAEALVVLWRAERKKTWLDRVLFLKRAT